jgi:hypothetical protein
MLRLPRIRCIPLSIVHNTRGGHRRISYISYKRSDYVVFTPKFILCIKTNIM